MRGVRFCLLCLLGFGSLSAQSARPMEGGSNAGSLMMAREMFYRDASDAELLRRREEAAKRDLDYQKRMFYGKAHRFVTLWSKMTKQMGERQTFDVKLAKQVSEAFHDLEKSEGWPVRSGK